MNGRGREESPMPPPLRTLLGHLVLVRRKTGEEVNRYPIDSDRVTIGRDYDACDIRLYYADVSKLHAEIVFDLLTNQASLHVHGLNGVDHAVEGGVHTRYNPPSIIPLNDNDTFIIRKRIFRFEYAPPTQELDLGILSPAIAASALPASPPKASPAKIYSALPSPGKTPVRRRASHRLSLVPAGKTFVPLSPAKNRRHSTLGLVAGLNNAVTNESPVENIQEENETVVDVLNGEDGETVYVEVTEDAGQAAPQRKIHQNPFMTPQQTRKTAPRNTSAVPRTRMLLSPQPAPAPEPDSDAETSSQPEPLVMVETTVAPDAATTPKTPRSVPLPTIGDTPYVAPPTAPRVPANVALSTPRGPITLHKALLVRSARKAWEETRSPGIDGAVESGNVETRRKSLSPKTRTPKESLTPRPSLIASDPEEEEDLEEEDMDAEEELAQKEQQKEGTKGLQWIYEDGTAEVSYEESESDLDSLEADVSLDVHGGDVLVFNSPEIQVDSVEEGHQDVNLAQGEQIDEDGGEAIGQTEEAGDGQVEVPADSDANEEESKSSTPLASRIFSPFYTPQAHRALSHPRRSLATIAGPPMRLGQGHQSGTPHLTAPTGTRFAPTPGRMGPPSRRVTVAEPEDDEERDGEEDEQRDVVATPIRAQVDPAALAEAKKRRESLATPRHLPLPPASGFKDPVREHHSLVTPLHPALAASEDFDVEMREGSPIPARTPMDDIRFRLKDLRRQSVQRVSTTNAVQGDRRVTVGFALPSTPARSLSRPTASYTTAKPGTKFAFTPGTPYIVPVEESMSAISSLQQSPLPQVYPSLLTAPLQDIAAETSDATPSTEHLAGASVSFPATPSFTGFKTLFSRPTAPKTPYLSGLRGMFPSTPKETFTPSLVGVKDLLKETAQQGPATPNFTGIKSMFRSELPPQTPGMEGMKDMYGILEPENGAQEESEDVGEVEHVESDCQQEQRSGQEVDDIIAPRRVAASSPAHLTIPHKITATSSLRGERPSSPDPLEEEEIVVVPMKNAAGRLVNVNKAEEPEVGKADEEFEEMDVRELVKKATRGKKVQPQTEMVDDIPAAPTRRSASAAVRKATTDDAPPASARKSRSRRIAATTAEPVKAEQDEPASKPSRARSTASKSKMAGPSLSAPKVVEPKEPKSRSTREKRVLAEMDEQAAEMEAERFPGEEDMLSKPSRGRKATTIASAGTSTSTSASSRKAAVPTKAESVSAPSRGRKAASARTTTVASATLGAGARGKAVEDKENKGQKEKMPAKRTVASRRREEAAEAVSAPARATRSRK